MPRAPAEKPSIRGSREIRRYRHGVRTSTTTAPRTDSAPRCECLRAHGEREVSIGSRSAAPANPPRGSTSNVTRGPCRPTSSPSRGRCATVNERHDHGSSSAVTTRDFGAVGGDRCPRGHSYAAYLGQDAVASITAASSRLLAAGGFRTLFLRIPLPHAPRQAIAQRRIHSWLSSGVWASAAAA